MAILFEYAVLDLVTLALGLAGAIYYYFVFHFNHWKNKGIPFIEPTPFFGNLKDAMLQRRTFADCLRNLYVELTGHKIGGIFQLRLPWLMIRDPEIIKLVMVKDFDHFVDHDIVFSEENDPLQAKGLFHMRGERWKSMRAKLSPTFTSGKMKKMFHLICECGEEMTKFLRETARNKEILEVKEVLQKYTTDVIGSCAFGIECNSFKDPNSRFREMGNKLFQPTSFESFKISIIIFLPKIAEFLKLCFTSKELAHFFRSLVKETMDYREQNHVVRNDFMQLLMELKKTGRVEIDEKDNEDGNLNNQNILESGTNEEISDDDITAQALTFFAAGFETSSTTLNFTLYELAVNPDIQQRLREEIDSVLKKYGEKVNYQAIMEMVYMDKVIAEALRKYPPIPNHSRLCTKKYTLPESKLVLEKGSQLFIPVYGLHHDPQYFPDPEKFDPERFSEENKKTRSHYVYLPFGEGPRLCIGMRFAFMQVKIGLVSLLSDYEFRTCSKTAIPLVMDPKSFVLSPKSSVWLQILNRNKYEDTKF